MHETVDVTALVHEGENVLGATIAGAWYTEKFGFFTFTNRLYGTQPSFLAQLRVTYADGTAETLAATGDGWAASGDGPVVDSGIYPGEHQDLRRTLDGWSVAGSEDSAWAPARVGAAALPGYEHVPVPEGAHRAAGAPHPDPRPSSTSSRPRPADASSTSARTSSGRLRVTVRGEAGQQVVIRHAEVLEDGELGIRPLRNAKATATFDLSGGR